MEQFIFTAKNISMEFSGIRALDHVDFEIRSGEIRALVGMNGAGKSTLMKVFAGVYQSYSGDIFCNGKHVALKSPSEAAKQGIGIVHQEVDTAVLPDFCVYENLLMDDLAAGKGKILYRRKKLRQEAAEILAGLGIGLVPDTPARDLTLAQKQLLLIAKQIHKKCRLLILDEPTASLSSAETGKLFGFIRRLAEKEGTAVIFISHRIGEILQICHSCTVMRGGRIAEEFLVRPDIGTETVITKMLGAEKIKMSGAEADLEREKIQESVVKSPSGKNAVQAGGRDGQPALFQVEGLCDRKGRVKEVSFFVRKGEIVGLAGLVGAGKTEVCRAVFGADRRTSGTVRINGTEIFLKNPTDAVRNQIALVPEERRREGIFPAESVAFNLCASSLSRFCSFSFLRRGRMEKRAAEAIRELGISCRDGQQQIRFLSGGNQQKAVMGKWMEADCRIYLLDEPMQGVDAGAKREIHKMIRQLARKGAAILYASSDISELLSITDRIYAMCDGKITAELTTRETKEEEVAYYIVGGNHG